MVRRRDEDIVDVKQQAASGTLRDRPDEIRFADGRVAESKIGRGIFEQDRSADRLLHFVDMRRILSQGRCVVGKGQEIVEIDRFVRRPGEMFRDKRGLIAFNKPTEIARDELYPRRPDRRSTCRRRATTPDIRGE